MHSTSGTVTILVAELVSQPQRRPADTASVLDEVVREAVARSGGIAFARGATRVGGVFETGASAAQAAVECQTALTERPEPLRVRTALLTGVAEHRDGAPVGPAVERAMRLAAVAHGGQVLVAESTAILLRESATFEVRDLGTHRLKDLGAPEHVHQLVIRGLRSEYPAPRSLDNPDLPNNLPVLPTPFVGRATEIEEVHRMLAEGRLVTLTGAGGAGKTRLAVQAGAEMLEDARDGVWLVELAEIRDEDQVPRAVVSALEIPESDRDAMEVLVRSLEHQQAILLLDNCEHLVDVVAKLTDAVLRGCPGVRVLATSREPLGLDGECVYRVPSLSLPDEDTMTLGEARASDAVALFAGRARDAGVVLGEQDALLVGSICRRLDGIPLALELAAARLATLSLQELSDRLDQRFRLLTGGTRGAMARQQTLQALVDWSYELLSPAERTVLQRLSVFCGTFDLTAAETVCAGDGVDDIDVLILVHSLVEKSLVLADREEGATRFQLLETIRQYGAAELLRCVGDLGVLEARDRHAAFYLELGRRAAPALGTAGVGEWVHALAADAGNLRTAIGHLVEDRPLDVLELVANLERFFNLRGAIDVIEPTLLAVSKVDHGDRRSAEAASAALIAVCVMSGWHLVGQREEVEAAARHAARAEELARQVRRTDLEARALMNRGHFALLLGDRAAAGEHFVAAERFARQCRNESILCDVLVNSLHPMLVEDRGLTDEQVHERAAEALALASRVGDVAMIGRTKFWYATQALCEERFDEARRLYEENLELTHQLGAFDGSTLNNLLIACLAQDDFDAALAPLKKCLRRTRRSGFRSNPGDLIMAGACIATSRHDVVAGAQLHGAADAMRESAYASGELYRTPADDAMESRSMGRARAVIGDEEFEKAYEQGRTLSMSDACDLALSTL